jgi:acetylornithine/succinyldiaminopimelate/putrescine aminotransferase
MLDSTAASTACEPSGGSGSRAIDGSALLRDSIAAPPLSDPRDASNDSQRNETPLEACIRRMTSQSIPNLLRLHLSPHVAQACYLLDRLAAQWRVPSDRSDRRTHAAAGQVFLANSGEEALSGALKLARSLASRFSDGRDALILDPTGRFRHFSDTLVDGSRPVQFLPGVARYEDVERFADAMSRHAAERQDEAANRRLATLVVPIAELANLLTRLQALGHEKVNAPHRWRWVFVACRADVERLGENSRSASWPIADIVVFDESFVERDVPFGAFAASRELFRVWSGRGMATFHSTTYQPNALSNMRLVESLRRGCAAFYSSHAAVVERLERDAEFRFETLRAVYSRPLTRLASALGLRHGQIEAAGHYYTARGRRIFDGVAGVACSVRGHNPPRFVEECQELGSADSCRAELRERLEALTGMPHWIPAVSGASAVEHALRIGLAAQAPRDWVLALRGGFGGKTLFALAGTWKPSLKRGLDPLYERVVYVDPFAPDAVTAVRRAFDEYPIGLAQLELIQGVGGVRETPMPVLRTLEAMRQQHGCLLSVDEVQTGMYRTGPFLRSTAVGVQPDLLTLGKGASDMIFPFALTLVSAAVERRLAERGSTLLADLAERCDYEMGVRSVLGTLRRAERDNLEAQVNRQADRLTKCLRENLAGKQGVREVRCFGLLIGIELEMRGLARRWLARRVPQLYLLELLRERRFPILVGFCQYEPHVLKLTPPLSITDAEVDKASRTLADVLTRSLPQVLGGTLKSLLSRAIGYDQ